jgi:hypothetical protein
MSSPDTIFVSGLGTLTGTKDPSNELPREYSLSQNYPNPFNPVTVISYQLPVNSRVSLKVIDLLGREVATLVNEGKAAGTYQITFDAGKLPSGVYFYRLVANAISSGQAGEYINTKKLLLLR